MAHPHSHGNRIQRIALLDAGLSESFEVNVGLHQGSVLSPLLLAAVMDVVSSEARSGLRCRGVRGDLSRVADGFRCRQCVGTIQEADLAEDLMMDGKMYGCVKSFSYLGDTLDGDGGADLAATARISNVWMIFRELFPFPTSRAPPLEMNGQVYASCVRSSSTYGNETMPLLVHVRLIFERAEMQMIRWMCGIVMKDRRTYYEELRRMIGVQSITTVIISGRLRWYGQVMRKGDKDWVEKCMGLKAEHRLENQ